MERNREKEKRDLQLSRDTGVCVITESAAPHAAIRAGTISYLCISASSEGEKRTKESQKQTNRKQI